jgi:hypothetical protein
MGYMYSINIIVYIWGVVNICGKTRNSVVNKVSSDWDYVYIVTDLTVLQIWTLLLNGRVRISAFPTQRFSEYTGHRNINPLLRNVYKQNA